MNSSIVALMPGLGLLCLLGVHLANRTQRWRISTDLQLRLTQVVLGLCGFYLVWLGFVQGHIPPIGSNELYQVWGFLGVVVFLYIQRTAPLAANATISGFLLSTLIFAAGLLQHWQIGPYQGLTPLWIWALGGKWLILWGGACLIWLVALALSRWLHNFRQRAANLPDTPLSDPETGLTRHLQHQVLASLLIGGLLLFARSWWGWGGQYHLPLGMLSSWVLMAGAWWTRFTVPHRQWWMWSLTLLSFLAFLLSLSSIAL